MQEKRKTSVECCYLSFHCFVYPVKSLIGMFFIYPETIHLSANDVWFTKLVDTIKKHQSAKIWMSETPVSNFKVTFRQKIMRWRSNSLMFSKIQSIRGLFRSHGTLIKLDTLLLRHSQKARMLDHGTKPETKKFIQFICGEMIRNASVVQVKPSTGLVWPIIVKFEIQRSFFGVLVDKLNHPTDELFINISHLRHFKTIYRVKFMATIETCSVNPDLDLLKNYKTHKAKKLNWNLNFYWEVDLKKFKSLIIWIFQQNVEEYKVADISISVGDWARPSNFTGGTIANATPIIADMDTTINTYQDSNISTPTSTLHRNRVSAYNCLRPERFFKMSTLRNNRLYERTCTLGLKF